MKLKKIIILFAGLIMLLPGITQIVGAGNIYAIQENRERLEIPTIKQISNEGFAAINSWYNDNFGLRDLLIRIQHQIDYNIFGYSKTLYFSENSGKEYFHYVSVIADEQINNERTSQETRESIVNVFENIKTVLESQEIAFKFIVPPQKNEVLLGADDQMPVNRPIKNMYYEMQELFEEGNLADNYVNIIDALIDKNKIAPVFYQTDFHWNDWGAAVAFGEVVNSYSNDLGMGDVYSLDDFKFSTFKPGYNDAQLASLSVLKYNIPDETTAGKQLDYYSQEGDNLGYLDYVTWENSENPVFDTAVLFIGDSYTPPGLYAFNGTHNGIVELFPKVYFCHWDYAKGALLNIPEDVGLVVVEAIESSYSYMDAKVDVLLKERE